MPINPTILHQLQSVKELCGFSECWVGHCKNAMPCSKHIDKKCYCGKQATRNCDITVGPFVCGRDTCDEHTCNANHSWW